MRSPADTLITIFGGSGFIGRYVVESLARKGVRLRIACRDPRLAHFLQPLASIGQLGFVRADVTKRSSIDHAVSGATSVINLVGVFKDMTAVHVDGARAIAEAATKTGASALVHVSAVGSDPNHESRYGATKGAGEEAVRAAFPRATIIRPSLVVGPEDNLTNQLARMGAFPALPVIKPGCRFQPIYVRDCAAAIAAAALDPGKYGGTTYELGGPEVMTMRQLTEAVLAAAGRTPTLIDLPDIAGDLLSRFGFLPGAPLTRDQWLMLQQDHVATPGTPGLDAFGIRPTPFTAVAGDWLGRYGGSRFAARSADAPVA